MDILDELWYDLLASSRQMLDEHTEPKDWPKARDVFRYFKSSRTAILQRFFIRVGGGCPPASGLTSPSKSARSRAGGSSCRSSCACTCGVWHVAGADKQPLPMRPRGHACHAGAHRPYGSVPGHQLHKVRHRAAGELQILQRMWGRHGRVLLYAMRYRAPRRQQVLQRLRDADATVKIYGTAVPSGTWYHNCMVSLPRYGCTELGRVRVELP